MNQNGIGSSQPISLRPPDGLLMAPACNQSLHSGNHIEIFAGLTVFTGPQFFAENIDFLQLLFLVAQQRITFWEDFILKANSCDVSLFQFFHQTARVVEVSVSGVSVQQNWDITGIAHILDNLK
jgi:hypothetical protein